MGRFDKTDAEWLKELQGREAREAVERGEEVPADQLPRCEAKGPGGVVCGEPDGHDGDHAGSAPLMGRSGSTFGELGRAKSARGRRVRHLRRGERVTWPQQCRATTMTAADGKVQCGLPEGHFGEHTGGHHRDAMDGEPYKWGGTG